MTVLTLGYAGRSMDDFMALLVAAGIQYVVDVRSYPKSARQPEFDRPAIMMEVEAHGMRYLFVGDSLGGRPADDSLYTDGHADYAKIAQAPPFRESLERISRGARGGHRICIVCVERRPEQCHRARLISEQLSEAGVPVAHIEESPEPTPHSVIRTRFIDSQLSLEGLDTRFDVSRGIYRSATGD